MNTRRSRTLPDSSTLARTALIAALVTLSLPLAQAATPGSGQDRFPISVEELDARRAEVFSRVDTDGDGLISGDEFAAAKLPRHRRGGNQNWDRSAMQDTMDEALFEALDANADGVISRDEFSTQAMREARMASMKSHLFERADQDGDGYLSPAEFPPRRLAQMDANGDGEITRDELPDHPRGGPRGGDAG